MHIALCAIALVVFCYTSHSLPVDWTYTLFVGSSTLLTYSLHRLIGIAKSKNFNDQGRYAVVKQYRSHIVIYSALAGLASLYFFYNFERSSQIFLFVFCVVSLLYTLPVFAKGRRLRDFSYIKIFLIAICWSAVTETYILYMSGHEAAYIGIKSLERFLFIFAITIPFDIRDLEIDTDFSVMTLPAILGTKFSYALSYFILFICILISIFFSVSVAATGAVICTYFFSIGFIFYSRNRVHDYLYSGALDGTMLLPIVFFNLLHYFIN